MRMIRRDAASPSREELRGLRGLRGRTPHVIASGRGEGIVAVVLRDAFALRREGHWSQVGWQDIQHGSWDGGDGRLSWTLVDGAQDSAVLTDAGRLPGAFMERVQASILVQERIEAPGGGSVVLSGRRNPAGTGEIMWMAEPSARVDMTDPAVREFIVNQSGRLADEFGL
ncbi:hypothetical protein [uncultured Propionibacterium sp.]|uniref:hypothetical protein n=1 Tax=uncultured Propionibacterium sp. TaxID=218066 RepID=UPI00292DB2E5|nr:hypothetical protein [uncultured Propionibacterium sp.]